MRDVVRRCGVAAALVFGVGAAWVGPAQAQDLIPQRGGLSAGDAAGSADSIARSAPLSMQSQLGAIPLVSPRAGMRAALVRKVQVAQIAGGVQLGETREFICPQTGCQQNVALVVNQAAETFLMDFQFVSRGTYVALSSRSAAIASVVEYRLGRPGPVFMQAAGPASEGTLSFAAAPAVSLRRLEVAQKDARTLAQGNVYTRKREPDLVLRISVGAPEPAK